MEIKIKRENYKQLIQCIYLGNLVFNEYRKGKDGKNEYSDFMEDILMQIVKYMPKTERKLPLRKLVYEKNEDTMLADLIDRIEDSVSEHYEAYRRAVFAEIYLSLEEER